MTNTIRIPAGSNPPAPILGATYQWEDSNYYLHERIIAIDYQRQIITTIADDLGVERKLHFHTYYNAIKNYTTRGDMIVTLPYPASMRYPEGV